MDQQQHEELVKQTAQHMHASLQAAGIKFDFKDLLARLEAAGVPDAANALQKIVDTAIFPWLSDSVKAAAASNFMWVMGEPVIAGLQVAVDAQLTPFLQSLPGQAQASS